MPKKGNNSSRKAVSSKRHNTSSANTSDRPHNSKIIKDDVSTESENERENELLRETLDVSESTRNEDRTNITPPSFDSEDSSVTVQGNYDCLTSSPIDTDNAILKREVLSISMEEDEKSTLDQMYLEQAEVSDLMKNISITLDEMDERPRDEPQRFRIPKIQKAVHYGTSSKSAIAATLTESNSSYADIASKPIVSASGSGGVKTSVNRFSPYSFLSNSNLHRERTRFGQFSSTCKFSESLFLLFKNGEIIIFLAITMNQRTEARPENKVSLWLTGYPAEGSIITESLKDKITKYLDEFIKTLSDEYAATGIDFKPPQFPSIKPKHGQLEIGCEDANGANFVLMVFGPTVNTQDIGIGGVINARKTLEVTNTAFTFLITAPSETTWDEAVRVCRDVLRLPFTDTWILIKEVKLERNSGQTSVRFAVIMPRNIDLRNRLMSKSEPEEYFYPRAVRKAWCIKYQTTEAEEGKETVSTSRQQNNSTFLHFKWLDEWGRRDHSSTCSSRTSSARLPAIWLDSTLRICVDCWACVNWKDNNQTHFDHLYRVQKPSTARNLTRWLNEAVKLEETTAHSNRNLLNYLFKILSSPSVIENLLPRYKSYELIYNEFEAVRCCDKENETASSIFPNLVKYLIDLDFTFCSRNTIANKIFSHWSKSKNSFYYGFFLATRHRTYPTEFPIIAIFTYNWRRLLRIPTVEYGDGRGRDSLGH